jgi:hypothetical protein
MPCLFTTIGFLSSSSQYPEIVIHPGSELNKSILHALSCQVTMLSIYFPPKLKCYPTMSLPKHLEGCLCFCLPLFLTDFWNLTGSKVNVFFLCGMGQRWWWHLKVKDVVAASRNSSESLWISRTKTEFGLGCLSQPSFFSFHLVKVNMITVLYIGSPTRSLAAMLTTTCSC